MKTVQMQIRLVRASIFCQFTEYLKKIRNNCIKAKFYGKKYGIKCLKFKDIYLSQIDLFKFLDKYGKKLWRQNIMGLNTCHAEYIKMPCPLLISSHSDFLIWVFDRNSYINDSVDPDQLATDLDLHCLLRQETASRACPVQQKKG